MSFQSSKKTYKTHFMSSIINKDILFVFCYFFLFFCFIYSNVTIKSIKYCKNQYEHNNSPCLTTTKNKNKFLVTCLCSKIGRLLRFNKQKKIVLLKSSTLNQHKQNHSRTQLHIIIC